MEKIIIDTLGHLVWQVVGLQAQELVLRAEIERLKAEAVEKNKGEGPGPAPMTPGP